jgi:hypothetical protein
MFRKKEISVELRLTNEAVYSLVGSSVGWRF